MTSIFFIFFFYQVEKSRCEYHLYTNDEYYACSQYAQMLTILEPKKEVYCKNGIRIVSDYRYRIGLSQLKNGFHVFKLKISCENRKHRLNLQ